MILAAGGGATAEPVFSKGSDSPLDVEVDVDVAAAAVARWRIIVEMTSQKIKDVGAR